MSTSSLNNTIVNNEGNTIKKKPIILIIVAIFLIIISVYDCFSWFGDKKVDMIYWLRPVPMLIYTALWIAATFLKKIGAIGFIILTILHFGFFLLVPMMGWTLGRWELVVINNFMVDPIPVNIALSILLLLHLKKMN